MPWYAPVFLAGMGIVMLLASRYAEAWMAESQGRARQMFGTAEPQPGSFRARSLTASHRFAQWFLALAGACLVIGAVVTAVAIAS